MGWTIDFRYKILPVYHGGEMLDRVINVMRREAAVLHDDIVRAFGDAVTAYSVSQRSGIDDHIPAPGLKDLTLMSVSVQEQTLFKMAGSIAGQYFPFLVAPCHGRKI